MTFLQLLEMLHGENFMDGVFCEMFYRIYRNNELAQKRHPLPRSPQFMTQAKGYLDWMNEQALKSRVEIVTDYRTRNGNGAD